MWGQEPHYVSLIPTVSLILTQHPGESNVMAAIIVAHPSGKVSPAVFCLQRAPNHLPGVYQMQVSGSLLLTTCPLQKDFWKKTTDKWTVSVSCHPPMVGSDSEHCEPASMKSDFLADIWACRRLISACTAFQPANKNQLWFISSLYLHMHRENSHWYCPLKSSAFFPWPVNSQCYSQ